MSQGKRIGQWARFMVWYTLAVVCTIGCNPLSTISFLTQSDPVTKAEYPLTIDKGPKKGKEVVVAVFVTSAPGIGPSFAGSESRIASNIAKKLPDLAKEQKQKLVVLEPALISKFKMNNRDWKSMHPSEWGKKLNADFVLDIQLVKMSLYEQNNLQEIYLGTAEVSVEVYDVDAGPSSAPKYEYTLPYRYPHSGVRAKDSMPESRFREIYLEHLAAEISMKHVTCKQGSGILDDQ